MSEPIPVPDIEEPGSEERSRVDDTQLVNLLTGYLEEAREAREGGPSARDPVWERNVEAFWRRADFTHKASWQSKQVLPEVPNFVERFAAGLREALVRAGRWYAMEDPTDPENSIGPIAEDIVEVFLSRSGSNVSGQRIGFEKTFADGLKAGCLKIIAFSVNVDVETEKRQNGPDRKKVFIRVEPVDGSELYFDPTGRGLYRIRRTEIDRHELEALKAERTSSGEPLYDAAAIDRLQSHIDEELRVERERMSGTGQPLGLVARKPITLDEYLCTILDEDGREVSRNQLVILANEREVIRGPEPNPFWHGRDWIVAAPIYSVPFSPYGATYVERFGPIAEMFNDFTNLILDATFEHSIPAKMIWPEALEDPEQLKEGYAPGTDYIAAEGWQPGVDFVKAVDRGNLPPESSAVWAQLERKLREGASQSEIDLGQLGKTHISAQAVSESREESSSLVNALAQDIEDSVLAPIVELVWWTAIQHIDPNDTDLAERIGADRMGMIAKRRNEFRNLRFKVKARGLSGLIARGRKLQQLLGLLNVIGGNQILAQEFLKTRSLSRLVEDVVTLFGVDDRRLKKTPEEIAAEVTGPGPGGLGSSGNGASAASPVAANPLGGNPNA